MPKRNHADIAVIIDRSGSMANRVDDTINGYNDFIEEQKTVEGTANVTLVLFDSPHYTPDIHTVYSDVPVEHVGPLTRETYYPRGGTPFYDALAQTITMMAAKRRKPKDKVIIVAITDGMENSSKEYAGLVGQRKLKALVKQYENKGWQFVFLAENIDTRAVAEGLSFNLNSVSTTGTILRSDHAQYSHSISNYRSGVTADVDMSTP